MSVAAHNMTDKNVKTGGDTQVVPANKMASDNPSYPPANTAAETLNILQGKLHARRQHCQALLEWVYAENYIHRQIMRLHFKKIWF